MRLEVLQERQVYEVVVMSMEEVGEGEHALLLELN